MPSLAQDLAAVVTRAIRRILTDVRGHDAQDREIENLLREEFQNVARQAASEARSLDE